MKDKPGKSISEVIQEAKTISEEHTEENEVTLEKENNEDYLLEEVIDTLKDNGIDYLDFSSKEIDELKKHFDKDVIVSNIDLIKENGLGTDMFINHASLMYDEELAKKIKLLVKIGKEPSDIYLYPNVLSKYSFSELKESIELLVNNGMEPKIVPLMAF